MNISFFVRIYSYEAEKAIRGLNRICSRIKEDYICLKR